MTILIFFNHPKLPFHKPIVSSAVSHGADKQLLNTCFSCDCNKSVPGLLLKANITGLICCICKHILIIRKIYYGMQMLLFLSSIHDCHKCWQENQIDKLKFLFCCPLWHLWKNTDTSFHCNLSCLYHEAWDLTRECHQSSQHNEESETCWKCNNLSLSSLHHKVTWYIPPINHRLLSQYVFDITHIYLGWCWMHTEELSCTLLDFPPKQKIIHCCLTRLCFEPPFPFLSTK